MLMIVLLHSQIIVSIVDATLYEFLHDLIHNVAGVPSAHEVNIHTHTHDIVYIYIYIYETHFISLISLALLLENAMGF